MKKLLSDLTQNLALALGISLEAERIAIYIDALMDLSDLQIHHAFKRACKSWKPAYGRNFPSPAELREYAEEINAEPQPAPDGHRPPLLNLEIDPEKLPKGWTVEEWKRTKLTLHVKKQSEPAPFDPNTTPSETRKEYATRLITEMRMAVKSGANSFPES